MAKDSYYFPHDYNARNDRKIVALIRDYKGAGYGIFWATCEMMHEENGSLEFDAMTISAIAGDINEDIELVKEVLDMCVNKYRLFSKQDISICSNRVTRNLEDRLDKKKVKIEAGRLGGIKSGESRRNENNGKQNEAVLRSASSNEAKEIKEIKERKVDEIPASPKMTENEFRNFSKKLQEDRLFIEPLFAQGVKPEYLEKWILRFHIQIVGDDKINKDYNEYRKHFKNWLNKQDYLNPPPKISALEKIKEFSSAPPLKYLKPS